MTRFPPWLASLISFPSSSTMPISIPGKGWVHVPGVVCVTPGIGAIILAPVSVCHHVSTIGHLLLPIFNWYQIHAFGLIGSPTVPSNLNELKSYWSGKSSPSFIKVLMAVGAV